MVLSFGRLGTRHQIQQRNTETSVPFFGETTASSRKQTLSCNVCGENENHCILSCSGFLQKSVPGRWNTAKQCRLCFRCLEVGHCGKFCPRSRQCGINGCQKLHHQLLHKLKTTRPQLNIHVAEKLCMHQRFASRCGTFY